MPCDGTFDTIVDNEIWLIDNATMDNLVVMIIMYYQINLRGMSDSMIFSTTAIGERKFFFDQWQSIINNPPQSYPEEFTP